MIARREGQREPDPAPEMQTEYDFSGGVRGKYAKRYREAEKRAELSPRRINWD
ncbi:MAG: hypothetical protein R6V58_14515 [Planctomycetota bacterium]